MTEDSREPQWYAQPFPPEGASAAEGIRNQLGRPELDLLTILVREAAQNSWDARDPDRSGSVRFGVELGTVSPAHADNWRTLLQNNAPRREQLPLRQALLRPTIRTMTVSDRGTSGLGGPTRADQGSSDGQDFVAFVRNVGEPRDKEYGGGTYGFGKGIFYLLSASGTVLVHTRCRTPEGVLQTRLIGSALWNSYRTHAPDGKERRYTGRHWWGDTSGEVIEPLLDEAAEDAARRLGLKPFAPEETGTSIVVINPHLDDLEPAEAAAYMADTMAWQLWPKMLEHADGTVPMRFSVTCDGRDVPVPDPCTSRPLSLFVEAYRQMESSEGQELLCHRPRKTLGRLGLVRRLTPAAPSSRAMETVQIESAVHHVCLMRSAELVVTYHACRKPGSEHISYAGVFRASAELDDVYAAAEPPTHDAWNPQSLKSPGNSFVRTTFTRLKESVEELLELGGSARGSSQVALGAASTRFSSLVGGAWGIGGATDYGGAAGRAVAAPDEDEETATIPGQSPAPGAGSPGGSTGRPGSGAARAEQLPLAGTRSGSPRPRVQYVGEATYEEREGTAVLVQSFRLPAAVVQRVVVDLAVALPGVGNRETDPPLGARKPELVGWEDPEGNLHTAPTYVIEGGDDAVWRAIVLPAPDTITEIAVRTRAVNAA
ncbi:hypothetical protein [Streptomyces sp. HNM0574]|uniref:hypothetical protein n=1 Tax=Streptomyces sp. HNM0574 TaxID=2714954 RepID=UPI00146C9381|nr:hypothetical protein [Streptomyces sp. HNM0574]NLU68427.1 hypothetical protein [Streptomyces sp. HNM0574]